MMNLFVKPDEMKFMAMAVLQMIENVESSAKNPNIPWNPESRKDLKDMITAGNALKIKMAKVGFDMRPLPDVADGEEKNYFTRES